MEKISRFFVALAVLLSDVMFAVTAYHYRDMLCGIEHAGYSAPASTAFLYGIPFAIGIVVCVTLAVVFRGKAK